MTRYKLNINTSFLALHRFLSAGSRSTITHRPPDSWPAVGIFQHFESEIDEKKKKKIYATNLVGEALPRGDDEYSNHSFQEIA